MSSGKFSVGPLNRWSDDLRKTATQYEKQHSRLCGILRSGLRLVDDIFSMDLYDSFSRV